MLTKTLLAKKRFANDGGTLTDADQEKYSKLYSLHEKEQEVQRIQLDTENAKKRAKKLQDLILEITSIRQQLVESDIFSLLCLIKPQNTKLEIEPFFGGL